jgi:hypothetical protein
MRRIATGRIVACMANIKGLVEVLYTDPVHQSMNHPVLALHDQLSVAKGVAGSRPFPTACRRYLAFRHDG